MTKIKAKFKVALVCHKDISDELNQIIKKNSVSSVRSMKKLDELIFEHSYYNSGSSRFDMNDRIDIYLGWYKEDIERMLSLGYDVDILEFHKSYADRELNTIKVLSKNLGDKFVVLDIQGI